MRARIEVQIMNDAYDFTTRIETEARIKAEPEAMLLIDWSQVCAGLVEAAIAKFIANVDEPHGEEGS